MNLLIYYNPNCKNFYSVYTKHIYLDNKVGQENGYGHVLVQILINRNGKYVNVLQFTDIYSLKRAKESIKSRLAKRAIRWLNKYRE